jgi:hypothetical protein
MAAVRTGALLFRLASEALGQWQCLPEALISQVSIAAEAGSDLRMISAALDAAPIMTDYVTVSAQIRSMVRCRGDLRRANAVSHGRAATQVVRDRVAPRNR